MACFYFLFSFFLNLLLLKVNCIVGLNSFVDTSSIGLANISTTLLADNGQTVYISFINGTTYAINKYTISNGVPIYINQYLDPTNSVNANKLFIFKTFLIAYQTNGVKFNVFYISNFTYYGTFVMNESINTWYYASSKGIILYMNSNGSLKYILQSNFLTSNATINLIANINISSPIMSVSPAQGLVAITSTSIVYVWVYQLLNYALLSTFNTNYDGVSGMVWKSSTVLIVFSQFNCIIYKFDTFLNTSNSTTIMLISTCANALYNSLYVVNLVYLSSNDQIVGAINYYYDSSRTGLFSYNLTSLQVTYFANFTFLHPTNYYNQADNNLLFSNNNATDLYFGSLVLTCPNSFVYDTNMYQCVGTNITSSNSTNNTNQTNTAGISNDTLYANQTNITNLNSTNTTNQINTTSFSNDTLYANQTNLTNLNSSNTTNQTNTSSISNDTLYANQTTNQTNASSIYNSANYSYLTYPQDNNTNIMILDFLNFVNGTLGSQQLLCLNSIAGGRTYLRPIFSFFINFDDLWLYVYHQREYDVVVDQVFSSVQQLQSQKWNLLPMRTIWKFLELQSDDTINQFSSKLSRTSSKFYYIQQNSNGFIVNTLTFFCSNVFIMFSIFLVLRMLFYLLFDYRISILFRNYSFWLYFLVVILQGNLQYLTYLFSFQLQNFFSIDYINKFGLFFVLILYFVLFIFSITAYYVVKYFHGKLVKYFIQNMKLSKFTAFYLAVQMGYRNILLGFLHSLFDQHYFIKIGSLMTIEIMFLLFSLFQLSKNVIFENHLKVWVNVIAIFLRILLIFTFFINYQNIYTDFKFVHVQIFYLYIYEMYVAIVVQCGKILVEIKKFIFNQKKTEIIQKIKSQCKQKKKQYVNVQNIIKKCNKKVVKIAFLDQNNVKFHFRQDEINHKWNYKKQLNKRKQNSPSQKTNQFTKNKARAKIIVSRKYKTGKINQQEKNITLMKQARPQYSYQYKNEGISEQRLW